MIQTKAQADMILLPWSLHALGLGLKGAFKIIVKFGGLLFMQLPATTLNFPVNSLMSGTYVPCKDTNL